MTRTVPAGLVSLVERLAIEHAACTSATRSALAHARNCGVLLAEAKAALPHGAWTDWLATNFPGSARTAQGYMRVAERWPELAAKAQPTADLTIDGALGLLATPAADAVERFLACSARVVWPATAASAIAYAPAFEALADERAECFAALTPAFEARFRRVDRVDEQGDPAAALTLLQAILVDADRITASAQAHHVKAERVAGMLCAR
jgi:hypothetical protein